MNLGALVALRKESVDRNSFGLSRVDTVSHVALRKESVDRNMSCLSCLLVAGVALRKESVDRNRAYITTTTICTGRSPQGERG